MLLIFPAVKRLTNTFKEIPLSDNQKFEYAKQEFTLPDQCVAELADFIGKWGHLEGTSQATMLESIGYAICEAKDISMAYSKTDMQRLRRIIPDPNQGDDARAIWSDPFIVDTALQEAGRLQLECTTSMIYLWDIADRYNIDRDAFVYAMWTCVMD